MTKNVCIYGAASDVIDKVYKDATFELGQKLAGHGFGLVYGGGALGLMGAAARGFLSVNGKVVGVVPYFIREFEEVNVLGETLFVDTMAQRKDKMEELSDYFIIVPGGIGTMDEFFQVLTMNQLKRYDKPVILFNIDGYYDTLIQVLKEMEEKKFLRENTLKNFIIANNADEVIDHIIM